MVIGTISKGYIIGKESFIIIYIILNILILKSISFTNTSSKVAPPFNPAEINRVIMTVAVSQENELIFTGGFLSTIDKEIG